MNFIVYCHVNRNNGKRYVGQTHVKHGEGHHEAMMRRWKKHLSDTLRGSTCLFHNAIRKHGIEAWEHEIIEAVVTEGCVFHAEQLWIAQRKTYVFAEGSHGYNMTLGGEGSMGRIPGIETRRKMSQSQSGPRNWNYGKFGSAHPCGKPKTTAQRKRISDGKKGWNPRPETRQRMSEAGSIPVGCFTAEGTLVRTYPNAKHAEADGFSGQQVGRACRGKTKSCMHRGFVWKHLP